MNDKNGNVLIVDDEPNALRVLSSILSDEGYNVYKSFNVEKAMRIVNREALDAVITDLRMPDTDGMELFEYIKRNHPDIPVIFLTAYGTVESAVQSITGGAYYYFIKPPDYPKLKGVLSKAVEEHRLKVFRGGVFSDEVECLRIVGENEKMQKIFETIRAVSGTKSSVLIAGETGTGKELIARALHYSGARRQGPFVTVNCAAIPRELLESELFGYEKGAFTNAISKRVGRFEEASGGTIFLDEIGEMELSVQAKLLRVLQEREVERLGSNMRYKVDFRLICSTNRDLEKEVEEGRFRKDLFYRINVVRINVPPLRERSEDIRFLVSEFLAEFCAREKKTVTVPEEAIRRLQGFRWPGNIRQLRNVIERAVVLTKTGEITGDMLPEGEMPERIAHDGGGPDASLQTLRQLEAHAVRHALHECNGNKSRAAKTLGISRKTFYKHLKDDPS